MSENKEFDNPDKVDGRKKFPEDFPWKPLDKKTERKKNRDNMTTLLMGIGFIFALVIPGVIHEFRDCREYLAYPLALFVLVILIILFFVLYPEFEKWYYLEGMVVDKVNIKPGRRNETTTRVDVETEDGTVLKQVLCGYSEWNEIVPHKSRVIVWRTARLKPAVREILPVQNRLIRLTDEQRMDMIRAVKPEKTAYWTYRTMDLTAGIQNAADGSLLVKIYHLHEGIRRSGDHYSEYKFLLFSDGRVYQRDCLFYTDTKEYKLLRAKESCPVSEDKLLEMIRFYFQEQDYLYELGLLAKEQYGLEGYDAINYNDRFLEEHYFSENKNG